MLSSILIISIANLKEKLKLGHTQGGNYEYILFKNFPKVNGGGFVSHFDLINHLKEILFNNSKENNSNSLVDKLNSNLNKTSANIQSDDNLYLTVLNPAQINQTSRTRSNSTAKQSSTSNSSMNQTSSVNNQKVSKTSNKSAHTNQIQTQINVTNTIFGNNLNQALRFISDFVVTLIDEGLLYVVTIPKNTQNRDYIIKTFIDQYKECNAQECNQISASIEFLIDIRNQYLHLQSSQNIDIKSYMYMYITQACNNGILAQSNLFQAHHFLTKHFQKSSSMLYPSWKPPLQYKSRNFINLVIREQYNGVYYDRENVLDSYHAYGTISCSADIDLPREVMASLKQFNFIEDFTTHSTCSDISANASDITSKTLRFIPISASYALCKYSIKLPQNGALLPIRGYLQQKKRDETKIQLLLQLKLSSNYKNKLESFMIEIPFGDTNAIIKSSDALEPSQGSISINSKRNSIIWELGTSFQDEDLEASLSGIVFFDSKKDGKQINIRDPFRGGYAKINFKILESTITGVKCELNTYNDQISVRINEEISSSVIIWNSLGEKVPFHQDPRFIE